VSLGLPLIYNFSEGVNSKRVFKTAVYTYYTLLFFRLMILYDGGDFMPYKSIFQDFDRQGRWEFYEYK